MSIHVYQNTSNNFTAGKISRFMDNWKLITSDTKILEVVNGYSIEFESKPFQNTVPKPIKFNENDTAIIDAEISDLLAKKIIERVTIFDEDEFISNIFVRPKKNGKFRVIINLKHLNEFIEYNHFKMETFSAAIALVTKDCYFGSIDLQDAYYSCSITENDRKYLRFYWQGNKYQYTSLAMGLASAPRIFTKLLKPAFSALRKRGHANVAYIDDSLLISKSERECAENILETAELLDNLGLTINKEKSVFTPSKTIQFLGFIINSELMSVTLTEDRANSIKEKCKEILNLHKVTIRELAQLIGKLVSTEPAIRYAPLFYKSLEIEKDKHLKTNAGNFEAKVCISAESKETINWWIDNINRFPRFINMDNPSLLIKTDSSLAGWGAYNETTGECYQGIWSEEEKTNHINYLELKAGQIALTKFCKNVNDCHVKLYMDNTVAVTYISKMGGKIESLNNLTFSIWKFCMNRNIWLSSNHIAGVENTEADYLSRHKNDDLEWMLDRQIFVKIREIYGKFDVDLFASKNNFQFKPYVSYTPDKNASAVDALSINWSDIMCYIFCPFSLIATVLQKIATDKAEAIIIAPIWPTQHWFPWLLQMICMDSYLLPSDQHLLTMPGKPQVRHPLGKMRLGSFRVSGNSSRVEAYHRTLKTFCYLPGESPLKNNIGRISKNGCHFVTKDKLIFLKQM